MNGDTRNTNSESKRTRPRRGYLLMEVTIAAAITAAALFALLTQVGNGLVLSISSARDVTAQGLVAQGIEEVRSRSYLSVLPQAEAAVPGLRGEYRREILVDNGVEALFGIMSTNYKDVTVRVTYPSRGGVRTHSAMVRHYE